MITRVCDCCKRPEPDADCRYFLTNKKGFNLFRIDSWYEADEVVRIDICTRCWDEVRDKVVGELDLEVKCHKKP